MSRAYDVARRNVVFCRTDDPLCEVARKMVEEEVGSVLVQDEEGNVVGLITDRQIFQFVAEGGNPADTIAEEIMTSPVYTVDKEDTLEEVRRIFLKTNAPRLVVCHEGRVVGVISRKFLERVLSLKRGSLNV
ncbi:MAG: CBS domain-containing protein [Candidatus Jordarchaeales archaeon]|nr:CBS domain-containing protein [Candidatus Jordarchaeia archaeon]